MLLYNSYLGSERPMEPFCFEKVGVWCLPHPAGWEGSTASWTGTRHSLPRPWRQDALSTSTVHLGQLVVRKVLDILVLWSEFKCLRLLSHPAFVNLGTAEDSRARLQHPGPS